MPLSWDDDELQVKKGSLIFRFCWFETRWNIYYIISYTSLFSPSPLPLPFPFLALLALDYLFDFFIYIDIFLTLVNTTFYVRVLPFPLSSVSFIWIHSFRRYYLHTLMYFHTHIVLSSFSLRYYVTFLFYIYFIAAIAAYSSFHFCILFSLLSSPPPYRRYFSALALFHFFRRHSFSLHFSLRYISHYLYYFTIFIYYIWALLQAYSLLYYFIFCISSRILALITGFLMYY